MFPSSAAIITAAGSSRRFSGVKKELLKIDGHTVLYRAMAPFLEVPGMAACVVTCRPGEQEATRLAMEDLAESAVPIFIVEGANTRQRSVFNALKELMRHTDLNIEIAAIHDGDRPFIDRDTIMDCIAYAQMFGGAVPGLRVSDTIVRVDQEGFYSGTVDREGCYTVQTPQCFKMPDIFIAHSRETRASYTDDASLFVHAGFKVAVVAGSKKNSKITYPADLGLPDNFNEEDI